MGEAWGAMCGGGPVSKPSLYNADLPLLKSSVLLHVVQIVPADNDGIFHLGGNADSLENPATDAHVAGEGALLIDVRATDGFLRSLEA